MFDDGLACVVDGRLEIVASGCFEVHCDFCAPRMNGWCLEVGWIL